MGRNPQTSISIALIDANFNFINAWTGITAVWSLAVFGVLS